MNKPTQLQKQHASAHAIGQRALGIFHVVVEDLNRAADQHKQVADAAQAEIDALAELRDSASAAAQTNAQQAQQVSQLISQP